MRKYRKSDVQGKAIYSTSTLYLIIIYGYGWFLSERCCAWQTRVIY